LVSRDIFTDSNIRLDFFVLEKLLNGVECKEGRGGKLRLNSFTNSVIFKSSNI